MVLTRAAGAFAGFGLMVALALGAVGSVQAQNPGKPGVFDYYVLTLSWSPAFCASKGAQAPADQCGQDKNYGFVVHGLWPQYDQGYPASCAVSPDVPKNIVTETFPIMPSEGLMNHEWKKHGTCSGRTVQEYFTDLRATYDRINLPDRLRAPPANLQESVSTLVSTLAASGQSFPAGGIVPSCNKQGQVVEVMMCFSRDLDPRACSASVKSNCPASAKLVR
ncbi:MAG: ribonuclease T2 [Niveispirillum sp.]|nr:ribonuclease T2 [Niveispirillum sp.]